MNITCEEIINRIKLHGTVTINSTKDIAHGKSISLSNGGIINCYNTGKHVVQGKNQDETKVYLVKESKRIIERFLLFMVMTI